MESGIVEIEKSALKMLLQPILCKLFIKIGENLKRKESKFNIFVATREMRSRLQNRENKSKSLPSLF
jgi:hypothetical protein